MLLFSQKNGVYIPIKGEMIFDNSIFIILIYSLNVYLFNKTTDNSLGVNMWLELPCHNF